MNSVAAASLLGTLEKQLRLLRELSSELIECRSAYVTMNLDAMYQHIATQTVLCEQLRQAESDRKIAWRALCETQDLDPEMGDFKAVVSHLDPKVGAGLCEIVTKLALAEGELRHVNRAHSVLIEGSRRTLAILGNVLSSFMPTYSRPSVSSDPVPTGEGLAR